MKKQFYSLMCSTCIIAFISGNSWGQNEKAFEKIFLKETQNSEDSGSNNKFKNVKKYSYYPDTLPSWFFNPPACTLGCIYAVGISDPDMEPSKAKAMAIHRAKAMAALYNFAKLQYFRDVYTSEEQSGRYTNIRQRFDTYFKISAASKVDDESFAVVDSHMTRYNESMILIKYTPKSLQEGTNKMLSVIGTVLFIEAQVGDAFEDQAEYELLSAVRPYQDKTQAAHFLYREKGNKFYSSSDFLDSSIIFPSYLYKYASPNWDKNTPPMVTYNGLWSKFTRELLFHLTLTTEQTKTKVKNLGERYNPESAKLSREVVSYLAQLKLNGIVFESDTMKLNLNVNEVLIQK